MRIEGNIQKSGSWWAVEIPLLFIYTQGKTKKEACFMIKDAVECLIDRKDFKVTIYPGEGSLFSLGSNDDSLLMAFALKQQRAHYKLSVREIAKRLGSNSPSSYSRYEQGKVKPSIDKFSQLLRAIDKSLEPVLKIG